jgi:hypothetical protein
MIPVDILFTDVDGCLVGAGYDPLGVTVEDAGSEPYFKYYRQYAGPQLVLCTGRGWIHTRGILERAGFMSHQHQHWPDLPALCEHGVDVVLNPRSGIRTSLLHELPRFAHLATAVASIRAIGDAVMGGLSEIRMMLERQNGERISDIQLLRKDYSISLNIPVILRTGGKVDSHSLRDAVETVVGEPLGELIAAGSARLTLSSSALDLTLPVGKPDGIGFLLDRYGTEASRTAYIGDSVSDIEAMSCVGMACCPADAAPDVRNFVRSMRDRGYVSSLVGPDGELDILSRITAAHG